MSSRTVPKLTHEIMKAKEKASHFMDIDISQWPVVQFRATGKRFWQSEFDAYLEVFGFLLTKAEPCSLRLLFDLSNAPILMDPRCFWWQSAFSESMRSFYECKIERTAIVLSFKPLRNYINGYFKRTPATRPKKFFASALEARQALAKGWST
jgi:hypothetical protein